jgi:serine/threonine protein kinase
MDEHESVFAKVSDFGLSAQLYSKFGESRNQSWQWLAPEVILEHGLTEKSDIYRYDSRPPVRACAASQLAVFSFAMIMWEVWSGDGQVPYEKEGKGVHAEDMRNSIARGGLRPALPDSSDQFHAQGTHY